MGNKPSNINFPLAPLKFDIFITHSDIYCIKKRNYTKIKFYEHCLKIDNKPFNYHSFVYKYNKINHKFTFLYQFNQSIQFYCDNYIQLENILQNIDSLSEFN